MKKLLLSGIAALFLATRFDCTEIRQEFAPSSVVPFL
jgi:hypothetical protein